MAFAAGISLTLIGLTGVAFVCTHPTNPELFKNSLDAESEIKTRKTRCIGLEKFPEVARAVEKTEYEEEEDGSLDESHDRLPRTSNLQSTHKHNRPQASGNSVRTRSYSPPQGATRNQRPPQNRYQPPPPQANRQNPQPISGGGRPRPQQLPARSKPPMPPGTRLGNQQQRPPNRNRPGYQGNPPRNRQQNNGK